jgi:hypothetical protein
MDREDWPIFQEIAGKQKASSRLRDLVKKDIDQFTREEVRAQQLAGLTEA